MTEKCRGHYTFTPTSRPGFDQMGTLFHDLKDCPRDGKQESDLGAIACDAACHAQHGTGEPCRHSRIKEVPGGK